MMRLETSREKISRSDNKAAVAVLCVLLFLSLLPLILMLAISLKDPLQFQANPVTFTFPFHFDNYVSAFRFLAPNFLWTFLVIAVGISLNLVTSSWAAYAFARYKFPLKTFFLTMITSLMFVPSVLVLYPLYLWNIRLGLRDIVGLIVSYWILGHCFSVFLLHNYFKGIGEAYFEAARMDGAGHLFIWWHIVIPLGRSIITTLAIMMIIWIYTNDYVWQYIMSGSSKHAMISVVVRGMGQSGSGSQDLNRGLEAAGYMVASMPMLMAFVAASKYFVRGLTSGGEKG